MLARDYGADAERARFSASHRVVTHAERVWVIRETDATLAPGAPSDYCLLCESALTVRCAWEYPTEWARLPDSELLRLFS